MYTFQDFTEQSQKDLNAAVKRLITEHKASEIVKTAREADLYDRQMNPTISKYIKTIYTDNGRVPATGTTSKLCSSFFRRLNTQRMAYSLGNGVTFTQEGVKERLGEDFDTNVRTAGYYSLIHGVSFIFLNIDHIHVFKLTEFAPLWDEETGALRAGLRYWQIDEKKPVMAVLYEEDGYTTLKAETAGDDFKITQEKAAYKLTGLKAPADDEPEVIGLDNYDSLPIIPLYGSRLQQSTLVGMKGSIDAYDLIRSGFANDLNDCSEIYWIVTNAGGMDDRDLAAFRERLRHNHIANVPDADDVTVTPYTQEIPYNSRKAFLDDIRSGIYEDFGGLDVHAVAAGATNDHIDAAYQPMDENADDFEYELITAIQNVLHLLGIEDTPQFKRNRISNQKEQTDMLMECASILDEETILNKLPFITPDEVKSILGKKDAEELANFKEPEE